MRQLVIVLMVAVTIGLFFCTGCGKKTEITDPEPLNPAEFVGAVSFATDLMPVFVKSCGVCHQREGGNAKAVEHGTYYEKKEDILSKVGTYIIAGDAEKSGIYKICTQEKKVDEGKYVMPPENSNVPKWSKDELAKFAKWIKDGAKDN